MAALHIDGFRAVDAEYVGPPLPPVSRRTKLWTTGVFAAAGSITPGGRYDEQYFYPLAFAQTIDDLDRYCWPEADWFDYAQMHEQAAERT